MSDAWLEMKRGAIPAVRRVTPEAQERAVDPEQPEVLKRAVMDTYSDSMERAVPHKHPFEIKRADAVKQPKVQSEPYGDDNR